MRRGSAGRSVDPRTLVERMTSLMPVPGAEWIRLHLADDAMSLWQATREASGDPDEPIPFWGMAWGGGLAVARYLRDHPDIAAGRRVLDLGSGSGLCAIAAALAGAQSVTAVEYRPVRARCHRAQRSCEPSADRGPGHGRPLG